MKYIEFMNGLIQNLNSEFKTIQNIKDEVNNVSDILDASKIEILKLLNTDELINKMALYGSINTFLSTIETKLTDVILLDTYHLSYRSSDNLLMDIKSLMQVYKYLKTEDIEIIFIPNGCNTVLITTCKLTDSEIQLLLKFISLISRETNSIGYSNNDCFEVYTFKNGEVAYSKSLSILNS